jgi:hypothetical protein
LLKKCHPLLENSGFYGIPGVVGFIKFKNILEFGGDTCELLKVGIGIIIILDTKFLTHEEGLPDAPFRLIGLVLRSLQEEI